VIRLGQDRVDAVQVGRQDGLQCKQGAMRLLKGALIHTKGERKPIHRWQARRRILLAAVKVAGHYVTSGCSVVQSVRHPTLKTR
jgi:hypothetical protein